MATEDGAPAAGAQPADKPSAPRPAVTSMGSSFINKNAGGKKFAPKVVGRRRPPVAPAAPKAPPEPAPAPVEDGLAALLAETEAEERGGPAPTPASTQTAPTQETSPQPSVELQVPTPVTAPAAQEPAAPPSPPPTQDTSRPPASQKRKRTDGVASQQGPAVDAPSAEPTPPRHTQACVPARSPKRVRTGESTRNEGAATTVEVAPAAPLATPPVTAPEVSTDAPVSQEPVPVQQGEPSVETAVMTVPATEGPPDTAAPRPRPQPRKKRLPWQAVNQPADSETASASPGEAAQTAAPTPGRRRPAAGTMTEDGAEDNDDEDDVDFTPAPQPATTAPASKEWVPEEPPKKARKPRKDIGKARKKRATRTEESQEGTEGAATADGQAADDTGAAATGKNTRKPRKDKGIKRKQPAATQENDSQQEGQEAQDENADSTEDAPRPAKRPRPAAPRRRRPAPRPAGDEGEAGEEQPKRPKGRVRETTPDDAEDHEIDPENMTMDSLATRNYRLGRISQRERKMREINWEEVKERRKREAATMVTGIAARRQADEELARYNAAIESQAEAQMSQRVVIVDGFVTMAQQSTTVEAQADREIELMEEVEEDDLTVRITTNSFLRESKRFPNEFMLPGQGTRWNREMNDKFYDALRMFGTDFGMIATLFPGSTRRSIKLKFNREERENATRVKAVLNGERNSSWEGYLAKSGIAENAFKDPEAIAEALRLEREDAEIEINAAKAKAEEEKRQRRIAGLADTDDEAEGANGANGKKKKSRKKRGVQWADEDNVEVVEDIDEGGWGDD